MPRWGGRKARDGREGGGAVLVLEVGGVLVLQLTTTSRPVSELSKLVWVGGEGGKDHPLLVVGTTQHLPKCPLNSCSSDHFGDNIHLVVVKVEVVTDTEPVSTLLASKTLKVVNIRPGSHYHLKGRDHLKMIKVWVEELSQI